jgi:hypothetical protein
MFSIALPTENRPLVYIPREGESFGKENAKVR